jgi:peptidoglycan hydrolase-like protein with peptidoglycan-binding domain
MGRRSIGGAWLPPPRNRPDHLSPARDVSVGQWVQQGQRLGAVGSTGNSTGPHGHYEERVSPYGYFNHRRPQFNRTAPAPTPSRPGGFKNWVPGSSHADITGLQRALVSAGCDVVGKYTAFYGEGTKAAVACFQRKQGWSGSDADGVVGPMTAERLFLVGDVYVARLRHGVQDSDSVRQLQQRLNEVLGTSLPITGNYGDQTRDAAALWQRSIDSGAAADGNLGPRQAERLFPSHRYDVL